MIDLKASDFQTEASRWALFMAREYFRLRREPIGVMLSSPCQQPQFVRRFTDSAESDAQSEASIDRVIQDILSQPKGGEA